MSTSRVAMQDKEIFTPEHEQIRDTVRKFAQSLAPHSEEWDEQGIFPREVFKQAGDLGLLGIGHDVEYGGLGLDWWYTAAYAEELVHTNNAGVNMALMVQSDMATPIINEIGSDEVKREFLEPAIAAAVAAEKGGPLVRRELQSRFEQLSFPITWLPAHRQPASGEPTPDQWE